MSKFIKPSSILLYILSFVVFVIIGAGYAAFTGAADGQGLAGGAIVLGYGIISGLIAIFAAIILVYSVSHKAIVNGNRIFFLILLILIAFLIIRQKMRKNNGEEESQSRLTTDFILPAVYSEVKNNFPETNETPMGLGFFSPNFYEKKVLYFYGNPNFSKIISDHTPTDSVVFKPTEYGSFEIFSAPPWLQPEHLKLDYDILYFRVQTLGPEFIEITVNTVTQNTAYIDRFAGKIILWPEFLLKVYSIEMLPENPQTIKIKPLENAGEVLSEYEFLQPISIKNEWIQVELQDKDLKPLNKGWLRWKKDEKLLISYSLLC